MARRPDQRLSLISSYHSLSYRQQQLARPSSVVSPSYRPHTPTRTQAVTTACLSHQPFPDAYAILPPRLPRVSSTVVADRPPQPMQQHPTSTTDRRGVAFRSRSCLPTREMSELLRYSAPNNNNERACLLKPTPLCLPSSRFGWGRVGRRDRIARFGFWKRRRRQFAAEATAASHH